MNNSFVLKRLKKHILGALRETDRKIILFVDIELRGPRKIAKLLETITDNDKKRLLIFHFDWKNPEKNQGSNIQFVNINTYLDKEDLQYVIDYIHRLTREWYLWRRKEGIYPISQYRDFQLGELLHSEFKKMIISKIKNLEILRKIIEKENPGKIIVLSENYDFQLTVLCIKEKFGANVSISIFRVGDFNNKIKSITNKIRNFLSDLAFCQIIDRIINFIVINRKIFKNIILIDPRAFVLLTGPHNLKNYLFCPLWKGWKMRWSILKKRKLYISLFVRDLRKSRKAEDNFRKKWHILEKEEGFKKIFTYRDIGFWLTVKSELFQIFLRNFKELTTIIENFKKFNNILGISCVVTRAYESSKEKAIIYTARSLKISTVYLPHGLTGYKNRGYEVIFCDYAALWGKYDKDTLLKLGNPENKLVVTGSQKYDDLYFRAKREPPFSLMQHLKIDNSQKVVTIATQPIHNYINFPKNYYMTILQKFLLELKDSSDISIILKLHPFDHCQEKYKEIANKLKARNFHMVQNVNIFDLLALTDILVTVSSTVALEAMMLKKSVVIVNFSKNLELNNVYYVVKDAVIVLERQEQIMPTVQNILNDSLLQKRLNQKAEEVLGYYLYKRDGQASQRTVDLINSAKIV